MYGKVFASLYQGTLRGHAHEILVFTNMIACCDRHGEVDKHPKAIADETGLTVDQVNAAIAVLESPDPESRSRDREGRRIVRVSDERTWGWLIVNHAKYRSIRDEETRREANADAVRRHRSKRNDYCNNVIQCNPPSSTVSHGKPPSSHAEAEAEADADITTAPANGTTEPKSQPPPAPQPPTIGTAGTWMDWRLTVGRNATYLDREGNSESYWAELFNRAGWDEFTKAFEYCHKRTKSAGKSKVFLSDMLAVLK